jgi:hypothetical protein
MDYYNRVEGFINYALSNLKNISRGGIIIYPYKRCKNKKLFNVNVVTVHLLYIKKKVHEKILMLVYT